MSKTIILDTEVFQKMQYNFKSRNFLLLLDLKNNNKIKLAITYITDEENKIRITENSNLACKRLKESDFYILKNIEEFKICICHEKLDTYKKKLIGMYEESIAKNFFIIKSKKLSIENIFDAYFKNKPPFNKQKKKYEFPDAFALQMIYEYANSVSDEIIVISNDKDFEDLVNSFGFSGKIKVCKKIEDFLDDYNKETLFYNKLLALIQKNDFRTNIIQKMDLIEFLPIGVFDPFIEEITQEEYKKCEDIKILEIKEDTINFSFNAIFDLQFAIEDTDVDNWLYDSEDKETHYFGKETYLHVENDASIQFFGEMKKTNNTWKLSSLKPIDCYEFDFEPGECLC